jgi:hypothetical protein
MRLKPVMGGLSLVVSVPLMGFIMSPPPSQASVSIAVDAAASCVWYLENIPTAINLQSETKYRGDPLMVSATIRPGIGFSGDPTVSGYTTPCSFFNSSFTTKKLQLAIDGIEFVARYGTTRDDSLSFGLDERPLLFQASYVDQTCQRVAGMPLSFQDNFGWGVTKTDTSATIDVVAYSDVPDYGEKNFFPSGAAANCAPELAIGVEISSQQSGPPAGAGLTYTFTGPSITFSMDTVSNTYDSVALQAQSAFSDSGTKPTDTLTSRTKNSTTETFAFSVDSSEIIYAGSLYGTSAEFRFVPTSANRSFQRPFWSPKVRTDNGFNVERTFSRDGNTFSTWAKVVYRIDYRYPGTDWVIGAASATRESDGLFFRVSN